MIEKINGQLQEIDFKTGVVKSLINVVTTADCVKFSDGETFQEKYDSGQLKGEKGDKGDIGNSGDGTIQIGKQLEGATPTGLFLKITKEVEK